MVFAGEVYPDAARSASCASGSPTWTWNLYGPTETNVCTYYKVERASAGRSDDPDRPRVRQHGGLRCGGRWRSGRGRAGGRALRTGSHGDEGLLGPARQDPRRSSFPTPCRICSDLVYRTGDLVMLDPTATTDFLGRRDHQIKSRGYRIELGDVESALSTHPDLDESAVVSVPHDEWGSAIVAWVTPRDGVEVTEVDVRRHVAGRLPSYMVPTSIRIVEQLPKTSTGKVDRPLLTERAKEPRLVGSSRFARDVPARYGCSRRIEIGRGMTNTIAVLRDFLVNDSNQPVDAAELDRSSDLLEEGILDSLSLMVLVDFLSRALLHRVRRRRGDPREFQVAWKRSRHSWRERSKEGADQMRGTLRVAFVGSPDLRELLLGDPGADPRRALTSALSTATHMELSELPPKGWTSTLGSLRSDGTTTLSMCW